MKKVFGYLMICALAFTSLTSCAQPAGDAAPEREWELVFQDDFSGSSVDTTNWRFYNSEGHAGNGLRRPSAFRVSDGLLIVTARMNGKDIVSGGMAHKENYKYGRFEFRVKTEKDLSEAVSGVILTWPESERWPEDGENDIYETGTDASRSPFHTFIHYDVKNKQHHFGHNADGTEWHTIAMEWEEEELRIFRDGVPVWTLKDVAAIPDVRHHLCIQLDAFKKTMAGEVNMYVDWVKIYQAGNQEKD